MYFLNGFVYGGQMEKPLKIDSVEPLENFRLRSHFSTGETKIFDVKPLFEMPLFAPLKDEKLFNRVYLDFGVPSWNNGEIDLSAEYIYDNSEKA